MHLVLRLTDAVETVAVVRPVRIAEMIRAVTQNISDHWDPGRVGEIGAYFYHNGGVGWPDDIKTKIPGPRGCRCQHDGFGKGGNNNLAIR